MADSTPVRSFITIGDSHNTALQRNLTTANAQGYCYKLVSRVLFRVCPHFPYLALFSDSPGCAPEPLGPNTAVAHCDNTPMKAPSPTLKASENIENRALLPCSSAVSNCQVKMVIALSMINRREETTTITGILQILSLCTHYSFRRKSFGLWIGFELCSGTESGLTHRLNTRLTGRFWLVQLGVGKCCFSGF